MTPTLDAAIRRLIETGVLHTASCAFDGMAPSGPCLCESDAEPILRSLVEAVQRETREEWRPVARRERVRDLAPITLATPPLPTSAGAGAMSTETPDHGREFREKLHVEATAYFGSNYEREWYAQYVRRFEDTAARLHATEVKALRERVEELERLNKEHREDLARLYEADAAIADIEADLSRLRELADRMSDEGGDSVDRRLARGEYRAWRDAGKEAKP